MNKKNVDNGHCRQSRDSRHKCSICGRVRYEKFMGKIVNPCGEPLETRYGNHCWVCVDNPDCEQSAASFNPY